MMKIKHNAIMITALNFLLFIAMITINGLANGLPINGITTGELSDLYPNLFVPAGITFSIWGLIYLLLLLMVAFQLISAIKKNTVSILPLKAQYFLSLNFILNITWIFLWHYKLIFLSLLAMLGLLLTLMALFNMISQMSLKKSRHFLAIRFPISVYFGWISVATIANVTALLVSFNWGAWGIPENIWTILVMIVGTGLAISVLLRHRCISYGLVVIWAYIGIIIKRNARPVVHEDIVITAYIAIALIIVLAVIQIIRSRKVPEA